MRFHGFQGSEVDNLGRPVAACGTDLCPHKKECWIHESSKEQGAKLDLSSLA